MLLELVEGGHVNGWDDPRMPTLSGLRRRGYTPESIRNFCERIGVAKRNNVVDIANLEHAIREDLNVRAPRVLACGETGEGRSSRIIRKAQFEELDVINNPEDPSAGTRKVPFGRVLYIERDDFMENAAEEVLPPLAGQRSAASLRILHQVHGRGEGSRHGRDRRAARDLRSGDARRRFIRWAQGESHAALGVGRACDRRRSAHLRSPVQSRGSRGNGQSSRSPESGVARSHRRRQGRAEPRDGDRRDPAISSSVSATSASTRTPGRVRSSSTARSRCATHGRGSRREGHEPRRPESRTTKT